MRRIIKSHPPNSLVTYARQIGASFEAMDSSVKSELKTSLLNEQGWVCGYCQQIITTESKMKIEHFCEQSICRDKTLDYSNLMAVCLGDSGLGNLHCDSKKATFNVTNGLPIRISPWIDPHMQGIKYASSGKLSSTNAEHDQELNIILNLNNDLLKEQRRKKYVKIFSESKHINEATRRQKMRRILENDLSRAGARFLNNFPGLSEYMLEKYCN